MFREMRRFKQQLDQDSCERILQQERRGVLAVLGDDGYPYTVPLNFTYEDGSLYFHGAREGHKVDAITRCPKASFCVLQEGGQEEGDWWHHVYSVVAFGMVSIVEDEQERLEALAAIGRKYFPPTIDANRRAVDGLARTLILRLDIEHLTGKHVQEK